MAKHISRIERPIIEQSKKHNKIPCLLGFVFSTDIQKWISGKYEREKQRA